MFIIFSTCKLFIVLKFADMDAKIIAEMISDNCLTILKVRADVICDGG